jgi:hypothetical protein
MCVMEAVAYVAGEPFSDHPKCASRVLTDFLIGLNDRWSADDRQLLKPFIPRLVGTNTGENDEETRRWMITDWLVHEYAPAIFRHVGLTAEAEEFEQFAAVTGSSVWATIRTRIYAVRDEQWKRRTEARERLRAAADADAAAVDAPFKDAIAAAVKAKKDGGDYWEQWQAAYDVFKPFYTERYSELFSGELGLKESALQLVDRLIEVGRPA